MQNSVINVLQPFNRNLSFFYLGTKLIRVKWMRYFPYQFRAQLKMY